MTEWIIIGIVVAAPIIAGLIQVAGRCSRQEEKEDGRRGEYNGII